MSYQEDRRKVQISKTLSWVLRHQASKLGLPISEEGFIPIDVLLRHQVLRDQFRPPVTRSEIEDIVATNQKKRFAIENDQIRATQGHSIRLQKPILEEITDPKLYPTVIHGTYFKPWGKIRKTGLSKMNRTHIHLAQGLPEEVTSGARKSATVLVYVDLEKAMTEGGLKFYKSDNGVILCEGPISPEYFSQVLRSSDLTPI